MIYWVLSLFTALLAYAMGSLNSIVLASNFVFHKNLRRLGRGNTFVSNFRRVYGWQGAVKLLLVELVLDLLPLLIGGWLFGLRGYAVVGRALAGFCLVMGRMYPAIYELKGSRGILAMIVSAFCVDFSLGVALSVVAVIAILASRYLALGTVLGALTLIITSVLVLDEPLARTLCMLTGALVIVRHIPAIFRMMNGKEPKLSLEEDISYKFDEKF